MGTLPAPLQPIPQDAVDVSFPPPQYSNIFNQVMGNAATDSDGWQAIFDDASQVLSTFPDFLSSLDVPLAALDSVFGQIDDVWEQDFSDTISSAISQGDGTFKQFAVDAAVAAPPTATAPAPPPTTGSGGAPTQPAPSTNCSGTQGFPSFPPHVPPMSKRVGFFNNLGRPLKITSVTFVEDIPGTFSYSGIGPRTVADGDSFSFTVSVIKDAPDFTRAFLTVNTDDPSGPDVLELIIGVAYGFSGCSTGAITGGTSIYPPRQPGPEPL